MSSPGLSVHCTQCGTTFRVLLADGPPTQWIPCPQCHAPVPIVLPRDPPPLFSWEIYPGLYPIYIPPRPPRVQRRRATVYVLLASLLVCAALVGTFGYLGVAAQRSATFTVNGIVTNPAGDPLAGVQVVLTTEANQSATDQTGLDGGYSFSQVPAGGVQLNATKPGYAFTAVILILTTVYVSGGSSTGIGITLNPLPSNNSVYIETPFPTLEQFVTDTWATAGLLAFVAVLDGVAIVQTVRTSRPLFGVAAGAGSLLSPLPIALLNIEVAFPIPSLLTIVVATLGGFAVGLGVMEMAQMGQTIESA